MNRFCSSNHRIKLSNTNFLSVSTFLLIVGVLSLAIHISFTRAFQVDEVEHIHTAYNISQGKLIYSDFWEFHNPLLYAGLEPLVNPEDPVGSFHRARFLILVFLILNIAISAYSAHHLSGPWAALLTIGFLGSNSVFIEHGIEVRPDNGISLCFAIALALQFLVSSELRRFCLQAFVLSVAFLFSQKAVFGCFAFGCLWLFSAIKKRSFSFVAIPMVIWSIPLIAASVIMLMLGNFEDYLRLNIINQFRMVTGKTEWRETVSPIYYIFLLGKRNLLFVVLGILGLYYSFREIRKWSDHFFPGFLGLVLIISLFLNPFPYPYLFVSVLPTIGVLASVFVVETIPRLLPNLQKKTFSALFLFGLILAALNSLPRLVEVARRTNDYQFQLLREVQRIISQEDKVFDMVGLYFRPDAYPVFVLTGSLMSRYRRGELPKIDESLRNNEVVAVSTNYRFIWLSEQDASFIENHFVHYDRNLFVQGTELDSLQSKDTKIFDVLKEKKFRFEGKGTLLIDGKPFVEGVLTKGKHILSSDKLIENGRLVVSTPAPVPINRTAPINLYWGFD